MIVYFSASTTQTKAQKHYKADKKEAVKNDIKVNIKK